MVLTKHDKGLRRRTQCLELMIDRRPAIIERCAGAADVSAAVDFAREAGTLLSVRGGGDNIAGSAVCDGGVMIDLSPMKSVRINPFARTARVEPGVTLGEFDREAQAFGLVTPTGINSTTGIAGLTLGGGFGWISRKFGLTADNLIGSFTRPVPRTPTSSGRSGGAGAISASSPPLSSACTGSHQTSCRA